MKPGSQSLAASIVATPAKRNSFTSRSCKVPKARSIRPLACGVLAQMMSMFSDDKARPNCVTPSPPIASLALTRKMQGNRLNALCGAADDLLQVAQVPARLLSSVLEARNGSGLHKQVERGVFDQCHVGRPMRAA